MNSEDSQFADIISFLLILFFGVCWLARTYFFGSYNYNEGVYLATARSVVDGHAVLYQDVFCSQPPLLIETLGILHPAANNLNVVRTLIVVFSILYLLIWHFIYKQLGDVRLAPLFILFVGLLFDRFGLGWTVQAEVPAMALASGAFLLGITCRMNSGRTRYLGVGVLTAMALLFKLIALVTIPAICATLVSGHGKTMTARLQKSLPAFLLFAAGMLATILVTLSRYTCSQLLEQVIGFHLEAESIAMEASAKASFLSAIVVALIPQCTFALLGLYVRRLSGRLLSTPLILMWVFSGLFMAFHNPLLVPHTIVLIAPVAFLSSYAFGWLLKVPGSCYAMALGITLLSITFVERAFSHTRFYRAVNMSTKPYSEVLAYMARFLPSGCIIATDDQMLAILGNRKLEPTFCDTSLTRINTSSLSPNAAVTAASKARVVILLSGRLKTMSPFVSWLENSCAVAATFGSDQTVYTVPVSAPLQAPP